jgi:hypothetical protein
LVKDFFLTVDDQAEENSEENCLTEEEIFGEVNNNKF